MLCLKIEDNLPESQEIERVIVSGVVCSLSHNNQPSPLGNLEQDKRESVCVYSCYFSPFIDSGIYVPHDL